MLRNTYFKHKSLHKYTWVVGVQHGMEVKSLIDLVLVKKDMLCYVQDVRAKREMLCCTVLSQVGGCMDKEER